MSDKGQEAIGVFVGAGCGANTAGAGTMEWPLEQFGGRGDGVTINTKALQAALDQAGKCGGTHILRNKEVKHSG